jgi:hypothetical protein
VNCPECADYELRRDHLLIWAALRAAAVFGPRPSPFAGLGESLSVMLGGKAAPTHYQRHHDEYARTGDSLEMERMLRQVNA